MAATLVEGFFEKNPNVKLVQLQWVDYSGVLRVRIIPKARSFDLAHEAKYYLGEDCMVIPISTSPRCFPHVETYWELKPDWESLTVCGFAPSHASVMCRIVNTERFNGTTGCPRTVCATQRDRLTDPSTGYCKSLLLGFEVQFVVLDESSNIAKRFDRIVGPSTPAGLRAENLDILNEIMAALELSGVEVYHVHSVTEGQFELALAPLEPLKAIDALMLTQETIRAIYARHQLKATTTPMPTFAGPRNGVHVHLTAKPALPREVEESFIAGILRSLPSLCLLGLANYDSYHRVVGGSAGEWVGWGRLTRQFPIREVDENRWEFKFLDATANIYLFIGALLRAGRAGIEDKVPLEMIGAEPNRSLPLHPTEPEDVEDFGIDVRMPKSLESALEGNCWGEVGQNEDPRTW
ncbi:hypothetical protein BJY00DRAFT_316339 [Aspergillus carlsbadensis]|nr:hypothetical protein BJY00DRAFT_316339 [Aspergillus carlsbadensis]